MPRLQVISRVETNETAFTNLLNYIARGDHCGGRWIGATNLYITDYQNPEPFILHQILHLFDLHQIRNKRMALHLFITFDDGERKQLSPEALLTLTYRFVGQAFPRCMTYFAVHDRQPETGAKLHVHVMLIPIDLYTGASWSAGNAGWYHIAHSFCNLLAHYVPPQDLKAPQVTFGRTPRERRQKP